MLECTICYKKLVKFYFFRDRLQYCKQCKIKENNIVKLLSTNNENAFQNLLPTVNITKVFKCLIKLKKTTHVEWLLNTMFKYVDFTQILLDNIQDMNFVRNIILHPTIIQWRNIHNNHTVLETLIIHLQDIKIINLLKKKLLEAENTSTFDNSPPSYDNINTFIPSAPSAPLEFYDTLSSHKFSGNWLLLYNKNN